VAQPEPGMVAAQRICVDGILLSLVDGEWSRLDEHTDRDVARAVGCDPSRAGSTISVLVKGKVFE